ncbi:unnamed protein product [Moneuplotes crassus]|uniref:Uncharacterized protein n=1 Tax=Euplotes crassus TaxID=5936 RepID=A0AAD2DAA0_EUPCR|nr:unnamed protein product [Moneuplotes crassus]
MHNLECNRLVCSKSLRLVNSGVLFPKNYPKLLFLDLSVRVVCNFVAKTFI